MEGARNCPFCGGDKLTMCDTLYRPKQTVYAVSCRTKGCAAAIFTLGYGQFASPAEALAAWNTRSKN